MVRLVDLNASQAREHLLKGSSYFRDDLPSYLSFEPLLENTSRAIREWHPSDILELRPSHLDGVNYSFMTNKDGRFAWRPYELVHPVIYVAIVQLLTEDSHWDLVQKRFAEYADCIVECSSVPRVSISELSDTAAQVRSWWELNEQQSLASSLDYSRILHSDVSDCYGSLYTHSISWALHGRPESKRNRGTSKLFGNLLDKLVGAGRSGQTNGIAQGSVLMDLIAELVLGYVDRQISADLEGKGEFRVLRYRDDYRIFTTSDEMGESVLQVISKNLLQVGMKLGVAKTVTHQNVVAGSIKQDKLAGIGLQGLDRMNAKTMQKELLRLHAFGLQFPNSGALRRLVSEFHSRISEDNERPDNLEVCVAIATDIGYVSPTTFPVVAGILSYMLIHAGVEDRRSLWSRVCSKMSRVPHNGYLDIWLQRVTRPKSIGLQFESPEVICRLASGQDAKLWESDWLRDGAALEAIEASQIVVGDMEDSPEVIEPREVELFSRNAHLY